MTTTSRPGPDGPGGPDVPGAPDELARRIVRALRRYLTESDVYVAAASRDNEMHSTDLNGLGLVMDWENTGEPATPGRLSAALHLSAPATSAMLDRLERRGHVTRSPHPGDRRSVVVHVTDHALEVGGRMFGPLGQHMARVLSTRTDAELATIAAFLEEAADATHAARDDVAGV